MRHGLPRLPSPALLSSPRSVQWLLAATLVSTLFLVLRDYSGFSEAAQRDLEVGLGLDVPKSVVERDFRVHFVSFADCSSASRFEAIRKQARDGGRSVAQQ